MVSLSDALAYLHPSTINGVDYTLQDDGTGAYIAAWHLDAPQPTTEELAAVTQEMVDGARLTKSLLAAESSIRQPDLLDATAAPVHLVFQVFGTRINDAFRAMGREPPLLQLDVLNDVRALIGLPPLEPP